MRKGQVTIFIIIGLILIISVAVLLFFLTSEAQAPWKKSIEVPEDVRPVFDMVNDCTARALKQGLIIQGLQGGYIDVPAFVTSNPESYLADPLEVIITPYWYYEGENRIPSKMLMKKQLGVYVKEQIQECVNLKSFEPKLQIQELDKPNVLITFAEKETVAEVKWPLKINTREQTKVQSEYFAIQTVRYDKMYDLAATILEEENKQEWLEKLTIDFMSADQKIPLGGMEVSCKEKKWNIEKIQDRLKEILFYIMPMVRIDSTPQLKPLASKSVYKELKEHGQEMKEKLIQGKIDNVEMPEFIPADAYEINKMTFDIHNAKTDLKAGFVYDNSKLMLSALPHDGKWLKSSKVKGSKQLIPFFCMNQWHFTYDIIYPVKVVIKDETAFDNEGYVLQYALPVIISDNEADRVNFGIRQFEPIYIGTGFCEKLGDEEVEITVKGFESGLPVAAALDDAEITLECMSIDCEIGKTEAQENGDINLRTRVPQGCGNPLIKARKEGYLEGSAWLIGDEAEIIMKSLEKFKPEFVIHPYQATTKQWQTDQNRFQLSENEKIILTLNLKDSNYEQNIILPSNESIELLMEDAEYDIEMYLLKNDQIIGGYKNRNLKINYDDLYGKDRIQFNIAVYRPNPTSQEELLGMMEFLDKGKYVDNVYYYNALKPVIS